MGSRSSKPTTPEGQVINFPSRIKPVYTLDELTQLLIESEALVKLARPLLLIIASYAEERPPLLPEIKVPISYFNAPFPSEYSYLMKTVVCGDTKVGKTPLCTRFSTGEIKETGAQTIGVEFFTSCVSFGKDRIKAQIWDVAGHKRYQTITRSYYRGASGALLVFDVGNRETFNSIRALLDEVAKHAPEDIVRVLVGNHYWNEGKQQPRQVSKEEAELLALEFNIDYAEVDIRDLDSVRVPFAAMYYRILTKMLANPVLVPLSRRSLSPPERVG